MPRTSPRILLLHIPPTDPLRRIYRLADSCGGTLGSPAGRSFDPSAEGAMTTARPPLSLIICPCLSLLSTYYCGCSLTVRTLCLRREEWDHDPPAVTTRKSYWRLTAVDYINRVSLLSLEMSFQKDQLPILCPDMCPHIYGTTAVCLSVMLSCLSCQKECTNFHALSESPLEVCILTRRVGTLCP